MPGSERYFHDSIQKYIACLLVYFKPSLLLLIGSVHYTVSGSSRCCYIIHKSTRVLLWKQDYVQLWLFRCLWWEDNGFWKIPLYVIQKHLVFTVVYIRPKFCTVWHSWATILDNSISIHNQSNTSLEYCFHILFNGLKHLHNSMVFW